MIRLRKFLSDWMLKEVKIRNLIIFMNSASENWNKWSDISSILKLRNYDSELI